MRMINIFKGFYRRIDIKRYYYKVVRVVGKKYYSFTRGLERFEVKYEIGKAVKAKIGKLFIFKRLKDAKLFLSYMKFDRHDYSILKVEVKGVEKAEKSSVLIDDFVEVFWRNKLYKEPLDVVPNQPFSAVPKGTLVADSVLPVEVIEV